LLGGILSFAVSEGVISVNPARGVKRPADQRREVRLSDDDYSTLGRIFRGAVAENPTAIVAIKLLALTGCRRGEIERLRWSEVDLAGRCLRLTDSKEGKSIRPLGRAALNLIADLPGGSAFVFPGRSSGTPFCGLPKAWRRMVQGTGLLELTPHGLRHAYASVAADLGYAEPTIAALLGHATHSITSRYIHHLDAALIAAADTISNRIAAALDGRAMGAAILPLQQRSDAA
jgi:integrase